MAKKKTLLAQFNDALNKHYEEYNKLCRDFDSYRGVTLDDEKFREVQIILMQLQEKYRDLHPYVAFIVDRYQFSMNVMTRFDHFLKEMKDNGAQEVDISEIN
jgi:hypothetical protein